MRRYTVKEIDELRDACEHKYLFGSYRRAFVPGSSASISYREADKVVAVEEMVRTYMLAGLTAKDLLASEAT